MKGLEYVGVTVAPGEIEFLRKGLDFARTLGKPVYPLHHLHAHFAMVRSYPYIALVGTSTHNELLLVRGFNNIEVMGFGLDMALGEAFNNLTKILKI